MNQVSRNSVCVDISQNIFYNWRVCINKPIIAKILRKIVLIFAKILSTT